MRSFRVGPKFYIYFTLITLLPSLWLATLFNEFIKSIQIGFVMKLVAWGVIEPPTTVILIVLIFWIYERFLWRQWPFKYLHGTDLRSRYEGEIESSFDQRRYPFALEIQQTLLTMSICLFTERSSSASISFDSGRNERGNEFLSYVYKNIPRTVGDDLDMRAHDGFAYLEIFEKGEKLEGYYFNDPRERGRHGKLSCTRAGANLKGQF